MDELIFALIAIGIVVLWISAAIKLQKYGGSNGLLFFFKQLLLVIIIGTALFFIIVYPTLGCTSGFLCGLGEILIFLGLTGLMIIIWPIILLIVAKIKYKNSVNTDSEIIDDL